MSSDRFTVGLVFSPDRQKILLLLKEKPPQHAGQYNGIGGRLHNGETPLACITRECTEETGLRIEAKRWRLFNQGWADGGGQLFYYTAICPLGQEIAEGDAGLPVWFPIHALPDNIVPDVPKLVKQASKNLNLTRLPRSN